MHCISYFFCHLILFGILAPYLVASLWFFIFGYVADLLPLNIHFDSLSSVLVASLMGMPLAFFMTIPLSVITFLPVWYTIKNCIRRDVIIAIFSCGILSALICALIVGSILEQGKWFFELAGIGVSISVLLSFISLFVTNRMQGIGNSEDSLPQT